LGHGPLARNWHKMKAGVGERRRGAANERGCIMRRLLYVAAIAVLGAGFYVADPPILPATEAQPARETTVASAESQSMVARLAEASMVMRRTEIPQAISYLGPRPEKLFGRQ